MTSGDARVRSGVTAAWPVATVKIVFAFLGFSALVTEVATLVARHRFDAGDFFSYFTVEANTLAVISLVLGAFASRAAGRVVARISSAARSHST